MSNRPSFLGRLTKFVVVPAALAATGFYVVAPRIGGNLAETKGQPSPHEIVVARAPQEPREMRTMAGPPTSGSTELRNAGPEVDVNVHRTMSGPSVEIGATTAEPPKPPKRRRHKKKVDAPAATETAKPAEAAAPKPTEPEPPTTPPPTDPPTVDQGGSGGAATAGGGGTTGGSTTGGTTGNG